MSSRRGTAATRTDRPGSSSQGSDPTICPRRLLMSVITAPRCSSSTVTVTVSTGSRRQSVDGEASSRRAMPAAVWKAMSEESTLCALPSVRVTRTSVTGQPARRPRPSCACTPFSTLPMNCRGTAPPTTTSCELHARPAGERLEDEVADRVLAVPAGLLDVPSLRLAAPDRGLPQRHR